MANHATIESQWVKIVDQTADGQVLRLRRIMDRAQAFRLPDGLRRADLDALPDTPHGDLSGDDIVALRRFAAHLIDARKLVSVQDGGISTDAPDLLFVAAPSGDRRFSPRRAWLDLDAAA